MKQALLIVDHFPPSFAPRMGYLAKYLKTLGWTAQVFSIRHPSKINKFDNLVGYVDAEEVAMPTYCNHHGANRLIIELGGRFLGGRTWSIHDQKMYKHVMKNIADKKFDIIVCSTASFFPLNCAYKLSEKLNIPIVLDFRDIYEQDPYVYSTKGLGGLLRKTQIIDKIYEFTYPEILRKARTVDVIWFNERKMPMSFYEVEHSTDIKNSLSKNDKGEFEKKF